MTSERGFGVLVGGGGQGSADEDAISLEASHDAVQACAPCGALQASPLASGFMHKWDPFTQSPPGLAAAQFPRLNAKHNRFPFVA